MSKSVWHYKQEGTSSISNKERLAHLNENNMPQIHIWHNIGVNKNSPQRCT